MTARNSPRKGTCKIYKTFDRIFNFWTYQDLTRQGKAISIEMCMVFQRVAEPNNSSLLENKVDFVHSEAIFVKYPTNLLATIIRPITVKLCSNNKENGYHLLAQPDRMNVQTTNLSDPK